MEVDEEIVPVIQQPVADDQMLMVKKDESDSDCEDKDPDGQQSQKDDKTIVYQKEQNIISEGQRCEEETKDDIEMAPQQEDIEVDQANKGVKGEDSDDENKVEAQEEGEEADESDEEVIDVKQEDACGKVEDTGDDCRAETTQVMPQSWVEIMVRGPQSDWRTVQIDQFGDFSLTQKCVFEALFYKLEDKIHEDVQLCLVGGGIIERNQAILDGDKLVASIYETPARRRKKKELAKKRKHRKKRPAGFQPPAMVKTNIAAFDPSLSYDENEFEARAKVQFLQSQQASYQHVASQPTARLQSRIAKAQFALRQMDFSHLESLMLAHGNEDHHQLVRFINIEWAQPLGFTLKMKRSPKENLKGHKTVKLYCAIGRNNTTKADIEAIEESTGIKEELCHFSLSFRYLPQSNTWILNTRYAIDTMWHTHLFYHSYREICSNASNGSHSSNSLPRHLRISPGKQYCPTANHTLQYFKSYKHSLNKLKQTDIVLNAKANGQVPSNEKMCKYTGNLSPVHDYKLIGGRSYPDGLGKREEDEETEEIHVRMFPQQQDRIIQEFKQLFDKLYDMRLTFKEQGEEDSFAIVYEENQQATKSTSPATHLFYQTPQMKAEYQRRNIIIFCGVNADGKTVVFGLALIREDSSQAYKFAVQSFLDTVKDAPGCFIIERDSQLRGVFRQHFPKQRLYYCQHNLHKTVKTQLKGISQRANFKDKTLRVVRRLINLPAIENGKKLEEEFGRCSQLLEKIPDSEQEGDQKGIQNIRTLFKKISDEKNFWSLPVITREFTAGCNIQSRNEMLKMQLIKDVLHGSRTELTPIEDALNYLLDFGWFQKQQENSAPRLVMNSYASDLMAMLPLTYEEFKITKACQMEHLEIIIKYLRPNLTPYACERSRYNIVQALKYWRLVQHDPLTRVYLIKNFPPNANRDVSRTGMPLQDQGNDSAQHRVVKVAEIGGFVFCSCMEYFNTGIPCVHQFNVALKRNLTLLFSERWSRHFEKASVERPDNLAKVRAQHLREQQYAYERMLANSSNATSGLCIIASDINIDTPLLLTEKHLLLSANGVKGQNIVASQKAVADKDPTSQKTASQQTQKNKVDAISNDEDVKFIDEPLFLGKSFLIPAKLRIFKNTDGGHIPWASTNLASTNRTTSGASNPANSAKDVEFFENAANPPTKREKQQPMGGIFKSIKAVAARVYKQEMRPIFSAGVPQKRVAKANNKPLQQAAFRPQQQQVQQQVAAIRVDNRSNKSNRVALDRQMQAKAHHEQVKQKKKMQKEAIKQREIAKKHERDNAQLNELEQKRKSYLNAMKERILQNKQLANQQSKDNLNTTAKGAASAMLKPTLAPKEDPKPPEETKQNKRQQKIEKAKEKAKEKILAKEQAKKEQKLEVAEKKQKIIEKDKLKQQQTANPKDSKNSKDSTQVQPGENKKKKDKVKQPKKDKEVRKSGNRSASKPNPGNRSATKPNPGNRSASKANPGHRSASKATLHQKDNPTSKSSGTKSRIKSATGQISSAKKQVKKQNDNVSLSKDTKEKLKLVEALPFEQKEAPTIITTQKDKTKSIDLMTTQVNPLEKVINDDQRRPHQDNGDGDDGDDEVIDVIEKQPKRDSITKGGDQHLQKATSGSAAVNPNSNTASVVQEVLTPMKKPNNQQQTNMKLPPNSAENNTSFQNSNLQQRERIQQMKERIKKTSQNSQKEAITPNNQSNSNNKVASGGCDRAVSSQSSGQNNNSLAQKLAMSKQHQRPKTAVTPSSNDHNVIKRSKSNNKFKTPIKKVIKQPPQQQATKADETPIQQSKQS